LILKKKKKICKIKNFLNYYFFKIVNIKNKKTFFFNKKVFINFKLYSFFIFLFKNLYKKRTIIKIKNIFFNKIKKMNFFDLNFARLTFPRYEKISDPQRPKSAHKISFSLNKYIIPYIPSFPKKLFRILRSDQLSHLLILYYKKFFENYLTSFLNIPISLYLKNFQHNLKINILFNNIYLRYLNQWFHKKISRKKKLYYIFNLFNILIYALYTKQSILINYYLSILLKKNRKHTRVLRKLYIIFQNFQLLFRNWNALKILIKGKINGKLRKRKYVIIINIVGRRNNLSLQTLDLLIDYNYSYIRTYTGVFGLHTWLYFKNN
jgi:hypothetical protein